MEWEYVVIDVTKTEQIHQMPRALTTPDSAGLGHFLASDKLMLGEILNRSDKSGKQSLTTSSWVLGWDVPLPHQIVLSQSFNFPASIGLGPAPPRRLLFVQVRRELDINDDGPSARRKLLRLLTTHFDDGDLVRPLAQLTSFDVPDGAEYSLFLRALKLLISITQDTERLFKRGTPWS